MSMPSVALFGGTFNPPHQGHAAIIDAIGTRFAPEIIYCIPAATPVHKTTQSSFAHRYALTCDAFAHIPRLLISDHEQTSGSSYTIDTVRYFAKRHAQHKLYLALGGDAYYSLPTWRQWRALFEYVHLVVFLRPHHPSTPHHDLRSLTTRLVDAHTLHTTHQTSGMITLLDDISLPISSTSLRAATAHA